ncbi:MAG: hypothetical protein K8R02_05230 [Anaerohalosphaeraceae bacterium]|nr:hypothetical protein [Anaerohalosphaeraceae bacterium]
MRTHVIPSVVEESKNDRFLRAGWNDNNPIPATYVARLLGDGKGINNM